MIVTARFSFSPKTVSLWRMLPKDVVIDWLHGCKATITSITWRHASNSAAQSNKAWRHASLTSGGYLQNGLVDFLDILHAYWYGQMGLMYQISSRSCKYLGFYIGFLITMATVVDLSEIWICHDLLIPNPDLCVRFHQDSLRNGREVWFQRYKGLAYYGMIQIFLTKEMSHQGASHDHKLRALSCICHSGTLKVVLF